MKISHFTISISAVLFVACAGTETYQKKMERYQARSGENILVPEIKTANIQFTPTKAGRFPASVTKIDNSMTNKKLYFLSLYTQYESLKTISKTSSAQDLAICPSYHTALITYQEKNTPAAQSIMSNFSYKQSEIANQEYLNSHPELFLPVGKEGTSPTIIDVIKGSKDKMSENAIHELMQNAVNIHLAKTYTELRELCDYGTSSNYYIYENLITHINNSKFLPSTANMNTLLKTTLFSNRAILTSFYKSQNTNGAARSIASEKNKVPFSDEVIARFNVPWANDYFNYLKENK